MNYNFPPKSDQLAIHTVFLPRENVLFIKEWIAYHIRIGVSHFYLYNNKGSEGDISYHFQSETKNKYGIDYVSPTKHLKDDDIDSILNGVAEYFYGYVTYVLWSRKDEKGKVTYAQNESIAHYYNNYAKFYRWTAFIDLDEFIYIKQNEHLDEYINYCEQKGYNDILMLQKKFADRYVDLNRYVIEISECVDNVDTRNWSPKHIIKNEFLDGDSLNGRKKTKRWGIHNIPTKSDKIFHAPFDDLRFHHYNVNEKLLIWMSSKTINNHRFFLNAVDDSMKRYYDFVNHHCLQKSVPYSSEASIKNIVLTRKNQLHHLIFNEPLSFKNIMKPRFIIRMIKELGYKIWRDISEKPIKTKTLLIFLVTKIIAFTFVQ